MDNGQKMGQVDWQARWIEPEQLPAIREKDIGFGGMLQPDESFFNGGSRLRPAQELKKTFTLRAAPVRATLYATAHGVYEASLNGKPVSSRRLAPETTRYDKLLYYQRYDVTELLRAGENLWSVTLADGWWIGRLGMAGDSCNYGDTLGFLGQLEAEYPDGTRETVRTDRTFLGRESRIRHADLYIGEKWDRTFVPGEWKCCREADYDNAVLMEQPTAPISVLTELPAAAVITTPKGELVLDFGQVLAGVVRLELTANAGRVVTLDHGEVLDKEGNFQRNILGRCKDQQDILVCGEGRQVFEPRFTYHGFRYVRVSGLEKEELLSATALVMGTPLRKTGSFETDNELLNGLQHCIEWSTVTNMTGVPTDCPQREKLGWTGDICVYVSTGGFLYDLRDFLGSWLQQMRLDQYPDGQIPVVVPDHPSQERLQMGMSGTNSSAVWGDACVLVPLALYRQTGDKAILAENFDMMQGWLDYIARASARHPEGWEGFSPERQVRDPYLWNTGFHFGDWLIPSLRERPDGVMLGVRETAAVTASCARVIVTEAFAEVCCALGKDAMASEYDALAERVREAVREEYVAPDGTVNGSGLQGLYVMVLRAKACDGELKDKVLGKLLALIEENGWRLDTGFSSTQYLLDVLYDNGQREAAYRLLYQTEAPSWLYMVKRGATTIWENWKAILPDGTTTDSSYNHYAFGCVGDWMYRRMGGIYPLEPGYRRVRLDPDFGCGLGRCRCSLETAGGTLSCAWTIQEGVASVEAEVPPGCTAELVLEGRTETVGAGHYSYTVKLGE